MGFETVQLALSKVEVVQSGVFVPDAMEFRTPLRQEDDLDQVVLELDRATRPAIGVLALSQYVESEYAMRLITDATSWG